jgi:hypothetical protein
MTPSIHQLLVEAVPYFTYYTYMPLVWINNIIGG